MKNDAWAPEQYNRFKAERARPFYDLMALVDPKGLRTAIDLGCGTGELTRELFHRLPEGATMLGIDSSGSMIKEAGGFSENGLSFRQANIAEYAPEQPVDLVFSNAALQWLPDHETLFPAVFEMVAPRGQVAIQIPANFDHFSHRIAVRLAEEWGLANNGARAGLSLERYAELLHKNGFTEQRVRAEIYLHPFASGSDVVEWTKGTLLTAYQNQLPADRFEKFVEDYRARILVETGPGPYAYTFKRFLLWGRK